jgi:ribosomal protein S27E
MRCPKCAGCLHTQVVEWPGQLETWCLNCSWRENAPYAEPIREPYQRRARCHDCQEDALPGRVRCAECGKRNIQYQESYRARKASL